MERRIYLVKTMSQYADGLIAIGQGLTMGTDVYAVGQSTDDEDLGAEVAQVTDEASYEVLSVGSTVAGTYNADDTALVQVGRTQVEKHNGRIGALCQPLGITILSESQHLYAVFLCKGLFLLCPCQREAPVLLQRGDETVGAIRQHVA